MGFLDNLKEIGEGVVDIVTAPLGLIVDTARAVTSSEYNPGWHGVFTPRLQQGMEGFGKVGGGLQFDEAGKWIGESGVGPAARALIHEAELIYNTEYQFQSGQAPIGLRQLGVDPGAVSLQRGAATALDLSTSTLSGNLTTPFEAYRRSANQSPGQALVNGLVGFHDRTPQEQAQMQDTAWYNMISGSVDAVSRWFADPTVLLGKSYKAVYRQRNVFEPGRRIANAAKDIKRRFGTDVGEVTEVVNGVRMANMKDEAQGLVYVVMRNSTAGSMRAEGSLNIPKGKDLELDEVIDLLGPEDGSAFINSMDRHASMVGGRPEVPPTGVKYAGSSHRPVYIFGNREKAAATRYASELHKKNPEDSPIIVAVRANNLPVAMEPIRNGLGNSGGYFTLADRIPETSIVSVDRPKPRDLDAALRPGEGVQDWEGPMGQVDEVLYAPDGTPWEPDDIVRFEEFAEDIDTALRIGADNGNMAQKWLNLRQQQRAGGDIPEGGNIYDAAMNSRVVQRILNDMDGKDALSIRLEYFPDNPMGPMLGHMMEQAAGDYAQRRTILMAAMGYKLPEFDTLPPLTYGRLSNLLDEYERVKAGKPPEERLTAMLGEQNALNDMSPEGLTNAVNDAMADLKDQLKFQTQLQKLSHHIPIQELRMPILRRYTGTIRRSSWYQEHPTARPIRIIAENKPRQWINGNDPQSDIQIKRQLEEAAPLGVTKADVDSYWSRYTNAATDQQRQQIVSEMEEFIVHKAAVKAGMDDAEFEETLRASRRGRRDLQEYLASRKYASGDNDLMEWYDPDTGVVEMRPMPLLSTQASAWIPLQNVKDLTKAASKFRKLREMGMPLEEAMQMFNQLWKPTVLLRGGWPIRVVADEQLRVLALTGSLMKHIAAIEAGGVTEPTGIFKKGLTGGQRTAEGFAILTGTRPLTSLGTVGARYTAKLANKLGRYDPDYWKYIHEVGIEKFVSSRAGYGGPNESTLHSMQALMGMDEMTLLDHLYSKPTGQWRTVHPGEKEYSGSWARVLSDQFGRDPLGRKLTEELLTVTRGVDELTDQGFAQVVKNTTSWLKTDATGMEIAKRMPWRSGDLDGWVATLIEELDGYTGHFNDDLMDGILNQKVTRKMMEALPERMRPDAIHGEIIDQAMGNGPIQQYIRDMVSTSFDLLGRLPTDTLSRQPLFKHLYANEMVRLRDLHLAQGIDLDENAIQNLSKRAREQAIITTKQYLYDLAESSRFGHMMRFFMPFYPAWQEVMKVWGGFIARDPSIAARGLLLWKAPNRANLIVKDDNDEEFIQIRLSEGMSDKLGLTGWAEYLAEGGVRFGKSSFNLALNSPLPSVGPLIQIPLNSIVKEKPELEASLKFLLPFGVNPNNQDILFSPLVRSIRSMLSSPQSDEDYQKAFTDALTWMDVQYRSGARTTPVTLEEAHDMAKKLTVLRLVSRLTSPAQPIFDSPLKPHADVYRQLIEEHGPEDADEIFLNEYGQEFFAITVSRTVSETGIPPTVEAEVARRDYEALIQKYPEYGRLIVGDEALGEFSMAAFSRQLTRPVNEQNPFAEPERQYREPEIDSRTGRIMDVDRRIGWQEYINAMDQLEIYRKQMGLPNLRVAEAEVLRNAKQVVTNELAKEYPAWFEDFNSRNELKWDQRIDAFREISKDPNLILRPDVDGLVEYLDIRDQVLGELNRRKQIGGASTLDAMENQDLAGLWDSAVQQILDQNIAFVPLYYRYLEGDPVRMRIGPTPDE